MDEGIALIQKKPVTLKTISQKLNISAMAVSKALRDDASISPETRAKVKQLAEELNYRPNAIAQSLRSSETKTLGLVIADSSLSLFAPVIGGVEEKAKELGYNIILSNARSSIENEMEAVRTLVEKRIDGLLLAASTLTSPKYKDFLDSFGIPYVFLMRRCEYEDGNYVISENIAPVSQMINYMIQTGSKKIHFINISDEIVTARDREKGYRQALENSGIDFDPKIVFNVKPQIDAGFHKMSEILEKDDDVSAVFCGCDMIAVGVMESILEHGLKIPEDIRVASHDDIEFAPYLRVPLTTVRTAKEDIGRLGAELLIEKITKHKDLHIRRELKSELVLRQST